MSSPDYIHSAIKYLKDTQGIVFEPGLTDAEVEAVEQTYGFCFPPDLRLFLQTALPVSPNFPNWRAGPDAAAGRMTLRQRLEWPLEGICFDIEQNNFWMARWGARPETAEQACAVARQKAAEAARLIPIYSHRYLPDRPCAAGNPVFSVYQTDIIMYGVDLPSYLAAEFGVPNPYPPPACWRWIPFWSEIAAYNNRAVEQT